MLFYQTKGQADQQIIFIHGNSQSSKIWDKVIAVNTLNEIYTLITIDLPGHGNSFRSSQPEKDYGIQKLSEILLEFIITFSNKEYVIVANSMATNLIGEIADKLSNCKGIFLTGASIIDENINVSDILQPNPNLTAFFTNNPTDSDIDKLMEEASCNLSDEAKDEYRTIFKNTDTKFRENWIASVMRKEYTNEIKKLNDFGLNVAIVFGENEKFANTHYLDNITINKWKDKVILIPNARHFIENDQPLLLAELIKEFAEDSFK